MPLVTFFSVLERPGKNRKGVATTPLNWLDEGYEHNARNIVVDFYHND